MANWFGNWFGSSGPCDYPAAGDVRLGTTFGNGALVGTLKLPAEADVKAGVQYGAGGTEFTGTYVIGAPVEVGSMLLLHSPADIVGALLVALGYGASPPATPWPIYVTSEPDQPDECMTVVDREGRDHGREMVLGERQEHRGVQVMVRSKSSRAGYEKAAAVAIAFDEVVRSNQVVLDGTPYIVRSIMRTTQVLPLGRDGAASGRERFSINALVSVRRLPL